MKEKILITGATGFVGACLTENLVYEGNEVYVTARSSSNKWRLNEVINDIRICDVDLCDENKVNLLVSTIKPDKIFHLATYGGYSFQQDWEKIVNTNIKGTFNLLNAASRQDIKAFINVGSSSEYGTKSTSMKESDILEPINTYGVTKAASTLYGKMLAVNEHKPIATVRLFSPFGYYDDKNRLIPSVILSCLNHKSPRLASGDAVRDFIFIEDTIELLKLISNSKNIGGKVYNCGSGKQHSVKETVSEILKNFQADLIPEWGSIEGRKSDTPKWESDMSLVMREFNWKPKYSFNEGIKKTVEWFKMNQNHYI